MHRKVEYLPPARPTLYMKQTLPRTFDLTYDMDKDGQPINMSRNVFLFWLFHVSSIPTAQSANVQVLVQGLTNMPDRVFARQ